MISKVKLAVACLWESFTAFISPVAIGWIFMQITGHGKGYDYNLGSEKGISIGFGVISLIIWLLLTVPCGVYIFRWLKGTGKKYVIIASVFILLLFTGGIYFIGGGSDYLKWFGIGLNS